MFASPAPCIVTFFCCWEIDQKGNGLFFFLSEVLIREEVKLCTVFMDDQASQ